MLSVHWELFSFHHLHKLIFRVWVLNVQNISNCCKSISVCVIITQHNVPPGPCLVLLAKEMFPSGHWFLIPLLCLSHFVLSASFPLSLSLTAKFSFPL